jgi:hypothetical protein
LSLEFWWAYLKKESEAEEFDNTVDDINILICPTCGPRIPADKEPDSGDE